ncbi:MAG TPA: cytochrome C oxidase subunit IV family protein [Thermoanaerobaculia bacterium]|jgi:cytochrome c oxidase subunit 4|nr:cytochrome C oxidase subunit IV family protein [Thermoanaerobaculia bacterium]
MSEHEPSIRPYILVFLALMVLTAATVLVAKLDLGIANDVVALVIAVTKATLVVLFFMHVKYSTRLTKLTVIGSVLWLSFLIGVTMMDYASRRMSDEVRGAPYEAPGRGMAGQLGEGEDSTPVPAPAALHDR